MNLEQVQLRDGYCGAVGRTPLVRLSGLSEETGCEILGKCEFLNPGGSVKDRVVNRILDEAYESGAVQKGSWVTEATAVSILSSVSAMICRQRAPSSTGRSKARPRQLS